MNKVLTFEFIIMSAKEYTLNDAYFSLDDPIDKVRLLSTDDDIMDKSVIKEGFMNLKVLPPTGANKKGKKKQKVKTDLPDELVNDLEVIKMRNVLDPKRFYKRNATKEMKDVQVGRVLDSPADFYHSRLPKKLRKKTLVDELLADAKFKKDIKRRYVKIIEEKKHRYRRRHKALVKRNTIQNKKKDK